MPAFTSALLFFSSQRCISSPSKSPEFSHESLLQGPHLTRGKVTYMLRIPNAHCLELYYAVPVRGHYHVIRLILGIWRDISGSNAEEYQRLNSNVSLPTLHYSHVQTAATSHGTVYLFLLILVSKADKNAANM